MILLWQRPRPWQRQSHFLHFHLGQGHSVTTFDLIVITSSIQPRTTGSKQTNTINIPVYFRPKTSLFRCTVVWSWVNVGGVGILQHAWARRACCLLTPRGRHPYPTQPQNTTSFPPLSSVLTFLALLATPWALLEYMYFHKSNSSANIHQIFCYKKWSNSRSMIWAQTFWTRMLPGFCFASL